MARSAATAGVYTAAELAGSIKAKDELVLDFRLEATDGAGGVASLERFDGAPVVESEALSLLVDAGFLAGPRRAVLRP